MLDPQSSIGSPREEHPPTIPEESEADGGLPASLLAELQVFSDASNGFLHESASIQEPARSPAGGKQGAGSQAAAPPAAGGEPGGVMGVQHAPAAGAAPKHHPGGMLPTAATAAPDVMRQAEAPKPRIPLLPTARTVDPATLHSAIQKILPPPPPKPRPFFLKVDQVLNNRLREEEGDFFLLSSADKCEGPPFWKRRAFWVWQLLLLGWAGLFSGVGAHYYLEERGDYDAECAGEGGAEQCANQSILWRVFFFLACIPAVVWASFLIARLFTAFCRGVEAWLDGVEQRGRARATAEVERERHRRRREAARRERQAREEREKNLSAQLSGGSRASVSGRLSGLRVEKLGGPGSGRLSATTSGPPALGSQGAMGTAAGAPTPLTATPLSSAPSGLERWKKALEEDSIAPVGHLAAPRRHRQAVSAVPSDQLGPGVGSKADAVTAAAASAATAATGRQAEKEREGEEGEGEEGGSAFGELCRTGGNPVCSFILSLEISYLAEHVQAQVRHCLFMGLNTALWYLFWVLDGPPHAAQPPGGDGTEGGVSVDPYKPPLDNRFWIFFRILLCLTLFLLANLLTRILSSLAGIKLKRMNHRRRMLEIAKREALLRLLLSEGLEDSIQSDTTDSIWRRLLPPSEGEERQDDGLDGTDATTASGYLTRATAALRHSTSLALRKPLSRLGSMARFRSHRRTASLEGTKADEEQGHILDASARSSPVALDRTLPRGASPPPSLMHPPHTNGCKPPAAAGGGMAAAAGGVLTGGGQKQQEQEQGQGQTQRRALSAETGDLSKAHLLALGERHFLEPDLQLKYWNFQGGPAGEGASSVTLLRSEDDARQVGEFVYRRIMRYLRLRREAIARAEAEAADAAAAAAAAAPAEKAAAAAAAAVAGKDGGAALAASVAAAAATAKAQAAARRATERQGLGPVEAAAVLPLASGDGFGDGAGSTGGGGGTTMRVAGIGRSSGSHREAGGGGGGSTIVGGSNSGTGGSPRAYSSTSPSHRAVGRTLTDIAAGLFDDPDWSGAAPDGTANIQDEYHPQGGTAPGVAGSTQQQLGQALSGGFAPARAAGSGSVTAASGTGGANAAPLVGDNVAVGAVPASTTAPHRNVQQYIGSGTGLEAPPLSASAGGLLGHLATGVGASAGAADVGATSAAVRQRPGFGLEELRAFLDARLAGKEADYAFRVLDRDFDNWVTPENVKRMVRQLHKDRVNLRKTLIGTNNILRKLDMFIGGVLHLIFILFYLLVFGVPFSEGFFQGFSALLLAFSFIFQSAISNLYENVMFIFLVHPFDVGDTLLLNHTRHDVEEIHLTYTRCLDKDNGRAVWPNKVLRDTPFINLSTSEIMEDGFQLLLDLQTAAQQPDLLKKIKEDLDAYCLKHRGELSKTGTTVTYRDITSPMGILLQVEWHYSHTGTSKDRCAAARTQLLLHTAQLLTRLGVHFSWPLQQPGSGGGGGGGGDSAEDGYVGSGSAGDGGNGGDGGGWNGGDSRRRGGRAGQAWPAGSALQPASADWRRTESISASVGGSTSGNTFAATPGSQRGLARAVTFGHGTASSVRAAGGVGGGWHGLSEGTLAPTAAGRAALVLAHTTAGPQGILPVSESYNSEHAGIHAQAGPLLHLPFGSTA